MVWYDMHLNSALCANLHLFILTDVFLIWKCFCINRFKIDKIHIKREIETWKINRLCKYTKNIMQRMSFRRDVMLLDAYANKNHSLRKGQKINKQKCVTAFTISTKFSYDKSTSSVISSKFDSWASCYRHETKK